VSKDLPRLNWGGELHRPVRDILTDAESGDVLPGVVDRDVARWLADHGDELALIVDVIAAKNDLIVRSADTGAELREGERDVRDRHPALLGVIAIVQSDPEGVERPRGGGAEPGIGESPGRRRLVEPRGEMGERVGLGKGLHRVGAKTAARDGLEVEVRVAGHERRASVDVGESESHESSSFPRRFKRSTWAGFFHLFAIM
jgi:hypothetical protein